MSAVTHTGGPGTPIYVYDALDGEMQLTTYGMRGKVTVETRAFAFDSGWEVQA